MALLGVMSWLLYKRCARIRLQYCSQICMDLCYSWLHVNLSEELFPEEDLRRGKAMPDDLVFRRNTIYGLGEISHVCTANPKQERIAAAH